MDGDGVLSIVDLQTTLPTGNPFAPMTEGIYYVAVARAFIDPNDSDSPLLGGGSIDPTGLDARTLLRLPYLDAWGKEKPIVGADDRGDEARYEASESAGGSVDDTLPDSATLSSLLVAALGFMVWRRGNG
jgi:hypothetical protein